MKRLIALATFALLGACETDPYAPGGPYETPYPYPAPVPAPYPAPYPEPYPPASPVPGGVNAPQPPLLDCPITASSGWTAWINAMPGPDSRPRLVVRGNVTTPTGGHQVAFDRYMQIRESYPAQAFVTLQVAPPEAPASTAQITHEVRWEWALPQPVGSVIVRCGDKTLAEITRIQTAY